MDDTYRIFVGVWKKLEALQQLTIDMHKPDLAIDFNLDLENCEKGPCLVEKSTSTKYLKDL